MNFQISYQDYTQSIYASSYSELIKNIKKKFKYLIDKFNVYYFDEENDKIIISNSEDFQNLKSNEKIKLIVESDGEIEELEVLSQSSGELLDSSLNESLMKLKQLTQRKLTETNALEMNDIPEVVEHLQEKEINSPIRVNNNLNKKQQKKQKKKEKKIKKSSYFAEVKQQEQKLKDLSFQLSQMENQQIKIEFEIKKENQTINLFEEQKILKKYFLKQLESFKTIEYQIQSTQEEEVLEKNSEKYSELTNQLNKFLIERKSSICLKKQEQMNKINSLKQQFDLINCQKIILSKQLEMLLEQQNLLKEKYQQEENLDMLFKKELKQKMRQWKEEECTFSMEDQSQSDARKSDKVNEEENQKLNSVHLPAEKEFEIIEQTNQLECSRIFSSDVLKRAEFLADILNLEKNKLYRFVQLHKELNDDELIETAFQNIVGITEL